MEEQRACVRRLGLCSTSGFLAVQHAVSCKKFLEVHLRRTFFVRKLLAPPVALLRKPQARKVYDVCPVDNNGGERCQPHHNGACSLL